MSWLPDIRLPDLLFLPGDSSSLLPSASAQAHASAKVWLPAQASASTPVSHLPASSKFLSSKVQNTLPPATASAWPIPASGSSVAAQPTLVFLHQRYDQRREVIALEQVKGTAESFLNERVLYSQLMVCVKVQDTGKKPCAHRAEEGATVSQWDHRIAPEADQHLVGSELSETLRCLQTIETRVTPSSWRKTMDEMKDLLPPRNSQVRSGTAIPSCIRPTSVCTSSTRRQGPAPHQPHAGEKRPDMMTWHNWHLVFNQYISPASVKCGWCICWDWRVDVPKPALQLPAPHHCGQQGQAMQRFGPFHPALELYSSLVVCVVWCPFCVAK